MTTADLLTYAAVPLFAIYFYLFQRSFRHLDPADRTRFVKEAALPTWRRLIGIAPIVLLFFVSTRPLLITVMAWGLLQLAIDTRAHHQRLDALGFDPRFRSELRRATYFSSVVFLAFASGMLLKAQ